MLRAAESAPSAAEDEAFFAGWRHRELGRVDAAGMTYVDYTGAALPPASLVAEDAHRLNRCVLGNPHSEHGASRGASLDLDSARAAILDFLHADPDQYTVILTANASAACRLVGEGWGFGPQRGFVLSADNHNSVNGIREFARRAGAPVQVLPLAGELRLGDLTEDDTVGRALMAFPAQSNFSGVRHPLGLVAEAQARGWEVLLDAAAFLHSGTLDLGQVHPEFVPLSLYKIAGYPTGLGALVARRDALARLSRPWFAGGTVDWVSIAHDRHRLREGPERFEDGTPSFLMAGAVGPALAHMQALGRARLARHLAHLTDALLRELTAMRHPSGGAVIQLYGPADGRSRGATIAFNLLDANGAVVPFWEIEQRTAAAGLALRSGCFCNPGCAEASFGWPMDRVDACLANLGDDFTIPRFAASLGSYAVGALRISLGAGSTHSDVERCVEVLAGVAGGVGLGAGG